MKEPHFAIGMYAAHVVMRGITACMMLEKIHVQLDVYSCLIADSRRRPAEAESISNVSRGLLAAKFPCMQFQSAYSKGKIREGAIKVGLAHVIMNS